MNTVYYPRLIKRVRAFLIDAVLVPFVALAALVIGVSLGVESLPAKLALFFAPILILEPALVAWTGGTVGHHLNRIKIVKKRGGGHINIFAATVRFVIKALLGWFSLISILTTRKHQAVHDLAAGSVVVHKDVAGLPEYEIVKEWSPEESGYYMPHASVRLLVIFLYIVLSIFIMRYLAELYMTELCISEHVCTESDRDAARVLDILWLIFVVACVVLGWRGKLLGCRRRVAKG